MSILDKVKVEQPKAKEKKDPKVYHIVWNRKDPNGEASALSKLMAEAMSKVYGKKVDPLDIPTGPAKAFLESLLRTALGK
jgi:hypothetical protein